MANPLTSFITITDRFGTQVNTYGISLQTKLMSPQTSAYSMFAEMVTGFFLTVTVWGLWLLDIVIRQDLFLGIFGKVYQTVLGTVYHYINPLIIATFAMAILIIRIFVIERREVKVDATTKAMRFRIEEGSLLDSDGTFAKRAFKQMGVSTLLLIVIAVLMANPFRLLGWMFGLVTGFANMIVGGVAGSDQSSASTVVDGVLAPILQMVNYGEILGDACSEQWSRTLASGGDVSRLSCLTDAQRAATVASWVSVAVSVVLMAVLVCLAWFAARVFLKASWYGVLMTWYIVSVPWRAALLLADPGKERQKLDKLGVTFKHAFESLLWLLGIVFIAALGPALPVAVAGAMVDQGFPVFLAMVGLAATYGFMGWWIGKYYGKKFQRDPNRFWGHGFKVKVDADAPPSSWTDFYQAAKETSAYRKISDAQTSAARKIREAYDDTYGTREAEDTTQQQEESVGVSREDQAIIDEATTTMQSPVSAADRAQAVIGLNPGRGQQPAALDAGGALAGTPAEAGGVGAAALGAGEAAAAIAGARGVDGSAGTRGVAGASGAPGVAGVAGRPGAPGAAGNAYASASIVVAAAPAGADAREVIEGVLVGPALPVGRSDREAPAVVDPAMPDRGGDGGAGQGGQILEQPSIYAGSAAMLPVMSPEMSAEDLAEHYRRWVRSVQGGDGGQDSVEDLVAGIAALSSVGNEVDEVAAAALRRHAEALAEAERAENASDDGVWQARSGERSASDRRGGFLGEDAVVADYRRIAMLANMLGMSTTVTSVNDDVGQEIQFESDTTGQGTRLRFGDKSGFGDDI